MNDNKQLPLRVGVGIVLLNHENNIFVEEEGEEFAINTDTDNQLNYAINLFIG